MSGTAYKVFFDSRSATREELNQIDSIVVEQEMDMAWEARLKMFQCVNSRGEWQSDVAGLAGPFARVRVEVRVAGGAFIPLIDGPVAGYESTMSSQPGVSDMSLVIRDDSVLMNREERTEVFEDRNDLSLINEMFSRFREISELRVDAPRDAQPITVKRGTEIRFLREMAHVHGRHIYVLPGVVPSQSIGCFLPPATGSSDLEPLVLMGKQRNVAQLEITEDSDSPERTVGRSLRISDQQIVSSEQSVSNSELLGALPAVPDDLSALRELPPEDNDREDPASRVQARNQAAAYAFELTGSIVPGCYPHVLRPYQMVEVRAGNRDYSGNYLISKAIHRISPSIYTQEFQARRDARSSSEDNLLSAVGSIL